MMEYVSERVCFAVNLLNHSMAQHYSGRDTVKMHLAMYAYGVTSILQ